MFCSQCEQTTGGEGCFQWGACGKSPEVDALQDLLTHHLRGLSEVVLQARSLGIACREADILTSQMLFSTLTNVNFDAADCVQFIQQTVAQREQLKAQVVQSNLAVQWSALAEMIPADTQAELAQQGRDAELEFISQANSDVDRFSLQLTILYGLRGLAAYTFHAAELGQHDDAVYTFLNQALVALGDREKSLEDWVALALKVGEINLRVLELLDAGHTSTYGHPVPTIVPLGAKPGKAILVSGHDIPALKALLEQTAGTGIQVYTHGELLPAHGYPKLKQTYPHLYGHYGTAWQNQTQEFPKFPGPIVLTTNCLMPPHTNYQERVFVVNPVGWAGLKRVKQYDFADVIQTALAMPGFTGAIDRGTVTVGMAHNAVLSVADQIIDAVKQGKIRHFFLVGGCDGAKAGRNYYSELVEKAPKDCVVMTLGCGKFRFFDQELGTIAGLPRLLDMGQCNDAYSAIQVAIALAKAFDTDVNQLPLSLILSWYEQKAVAVLLTLLHLGIQDIRLGPTLPAFISPNVFKLLSETYHLKPIATPEADLAACLAK
jgi:hydroxylamine reductase